MNGMGAAPKPSRARTIARFVLALIYLIAGIAHLRSPAGFVKITPEWVPAPEWVIWATGLCEISGALAFAFIPRLHRASGIALAAYAVCVYPANINHAANAIALGGTTLGWWYHGPRLALQPVLVWWALWAGRVTDWPFARQTSG